jgi:hypothetical protein
MMLNYLRSLFGGGVDAPLDLELAARILDNL